MILTVPESELSIDLPWPSMLLRDEPRRGARNFDGTDDGTIDLGNIYPFRHDERWLLGAMHKSDVLTGDERNIVGKLGNLGINRHMEFYISQNDRVTLTMDNVPAIEGSAVQVTDRWYFSMIFNNGSGAAGGMNLVTIDMEDWQLIDNQFNNGAYVTASSNAADIEIGNREISGNNFDGDLAHVFCIAGGSYDMNDAYRFIDNPAKTFDEWKQKGGDPIFYFPLNDNVEASGLVRDQSGKNNHGTAGSGSSPIAANPPIRYSGEYINRITNAKGAKPNTYPLPDSRFEMPELYIPGRKPVGDVMIDWENPLTKGIVQCVLFAQQGTAIADLIKGLYSWNLLQAGTKGADSGFEAGQWRTYNSGAASSSDIGVIYQDFTAWDYATTDLWSALSVGDRPHLAGGNVGSALDENRGFVINPTQVRFRRVTGSVDISSSFSDSKAVGLAKQGTNGTLVSADGITRDTIATGSTDFANSACDNVGIGSGWTENIADWSFQVERSVSMVVRWNRALSQSELDSITADPYQFLIPADE
jgi:hypothetical protein